MKILSKIPYEVWFGLFACLFIGTIAFLANRQHQADQAKYDATHDPFRVAYQNTGIFDLHAMQPLGSIDLADTQIHGVYFGSLFASAAEITGSTETVLCLRFRWTTPSGVEKVMTYPFERINWVPDDQYQSPKLELVFTQATLNQQISTMQDLSIYDYNWFFGQTIAINIYLSQELMDSELGNLQR